MPRCRLTQKSMSEDYFAKLCDQFNGPECNAVIHRGKGHQSTAKCIRRGRHSTHTDGQNYWKKQEDFTGYFDESPLEGIEDEDDWPIFKDEACELLIAEVVRLRKLLSKLDKTKGKVT